MIILKTPDEIAVMAQASKVVAETLQILQKVVRAGITTDELDRLAEEEIRSRGAKPAFKGYRNYPKTLCASVNDQVVHGIPSKRVLKEGDIIGLDLGAIVGGFYGDSAVTVPVGRTAEQYARLVQVTEEAMYLGIEQAVVGHRLSDISYAVQKHVESAGYSVVTEFVGHELAGSCTKSLRCRIMGSLGKDHGCRQGWFLPSNRWSIWAPPPSRFLRIAGRR